MGRTIPAESKLARALFSQVQLRVLGLLFGAPDQRFHASQIIRLAGSGSGAVQRELEKLSKVGILTTALSGNRRVYQANRASPIFEEVRGLILKTVGLVDPLKRALKPYVPKIEVAFVYGSMASGSDTASSDIDLMIIGEGLSYSDIYTSLEKAEKVLLRPVNPNLMSAAEWKRKIADNAPFLRKILQRPKLFIYGGEDELKAIGQSR